MDTLDLIYQNNLLLDNFQSERYEKTLRSLMLVLIVQMRKSSPVFNYFFNEIYFGGSFFDGLKLASTSQEFDLNIVFKFKSQISIVGLNTERCKPNFAYLKLESGYIFGPTKTEKELSDEWKLKELVYISPSKLFQVLKEAIDQSLYSLNGKIILDNGKEYKIEKESDRGVAYTLYVVCKEENFECKIDLVPAISLHVNQLDREVLNRVKTINKLFHSTVTRCMAVALNTRDKNRFQIDFHDLERDILKHKLRAKQIVMLMKHLRDIKQGPLGKSWSHLIKTIVMNQVIHSENQSVWNKIFKKKSWDETNGLEHCLIKCLEAWENGLKNGVFDVFFPDLDLMDRLSKYPQVIDRNV